MDIFPKSSKCFQLAYFTMLMPKCNGVILMKTHIDCAHPKLFAAKKKQLIEMIPLDHIQQLAKKRVGVIGSAITNFLGSSNLYK
jgi:hypothetical protein